MAESKNLRLDTNDEARGLAEMVLRTCRYGALAWIEPGTGVPVTSRVGCAPDIDGTVFFPASGLSAHTKALAEDSRCSLLIGEPGKGDPLAHPRLSLVARVVRQDRLEGPQSLKVILRHNRVCDNTTVVLLRKLSIHHIP